MFNREQLDRYSRHIILKGVGAMGQQKLMQSKILVIGAGGLGSPILMYLAAAGIGKIGIVDFDKVDLSNLQRQIIHSSQNTGKAKTESAKETLEQINPHVELELFNHPLNSANARGVIREFDLVIDGSDNFPTRYLVNDACVLEDKPLLHGAISQFEGQISLFNTPLANSSEKSPCYRCLFPIPPQAGSIPSCSEAGVFGALPGIIGSMMAAETIKHLLQLGESLAGKLFYYDALYNDTRNVEIKRNKACELCGDEASIKDLVDYEVFCGEALPKV